MESNEFVSVLLQQSWLATLLGVLLLCAKALLDKRLSPQWHYALWFLLILRLVAPAGPSSAISLSNYINPWNWGQTEPYETAFRYALQFPKLSTADATIASDPGNGAQAISAYLKKYGLLLIWLSGVTSLAAGIATGSLRISCQVKRATRITDLKILRQFQECLREMNIRRDVALLQTQEISTPLLTGLMRPAILLPRDVASNYTIDELRFVFLHELMHLRRGDLVTNWIVAALQVVHWFNPVLWFAFSRMRSDREIACDAAVLNHVGESHAPGYGRLILKAAENFVDARIPICALGAIENKSQTAVRVQRIVSFKASPRNSWILAVCVVFVLLCATFTKAQTSTQHPASSVAQSPQSQTSTLRDLGTTSIQDNTSTFQGQKPFKLLVAPDTGTLNYRFSPNKELESIEAKTGVVFSDDTTSITCDHLVYDVHKRELIAEAPGLVVRQGNQEYQGNTFRLNMENQSAEIEGDAVIRSWSANGTLRTMSGERIVITPNNGAQQLKVSGNRPYIKTNQGSESVLRPTSLDPNTIR